MEGLEATGSVEDDAEVAGEGRGEGGGALVWVDLGIEENKISLIAHRGTRCRQDLETG